MENATIRGRDAVLEVGKSLDADFSLDDRRTAEIYRHVFEYFAQQPGGSLNQNRGLLVTGSIGVGKTFLFRVMSQIFAKAPTGFVFVTALQLEQMYKENRKEGELPILKDYGMTLHRNLLIDDVGTEETEFMDFKNPVRIMTSLLYQRYELYSRSRGQFKTHLITNMTSELLEKRVGDRNFDRLLGMTDMIKWTGISKRPNSNPNPTPHGK